MSSIHQEIKMLYDNRYKLNENSECKGRKDYKHKTFLKYIRLNGMVGEEPVRIFLVKYGSNQNWNIIISSDTTISFDKCFETYQMRWNIEVMAKECKQYLELGKYQEGILTVRLPTINSASLPTRY